MRIWKPHCMCSNIQHIPCTFPAAWPRQRAPPRPRTTGRCRACHSQGPRADHGSGRDAQHGSDPSWQPPRGFEHMHPSAMPPISNGQQTGTVGCDSCFHARPDNTHAYTHSNKSRGIKCLGFHTALVRTEFTNAAKPSSWPRSVHAITCTHDMGRSVWRQI